MEEEELLANFWEHVAELRKILITSFFIIVIGFFLSLCFYQSLFQVLTAPINEAKPFSLTKLIVKHERIANQTNQPLSYQFPLHARLVHKSLEVEEINPHTYHIPPNHFIDYELPEFDRKLLLLSPLEGILIAFKICFWIGLAITSPLWVYVVLSFIRPGLREREKNILIPFILSSFIFVMSGLGLAYFLTIPMANFYFEGFNEGIGQNLWSLEHYINYTLVLLLGHAVAFEVCVLLFFSVHFQWISIDWLISKRRYMIVSAFILGGLLTPPDIFTQLLLAFPLIGIFELALLYGKKRACQITTV